MYRHSRSSFLRSQAAQRVPLLSIFVELVRDQHPRLSFARKTCYQQNQPARNTEGNETVVPVESVRRVIFSIDHQSKHDGFRAGGSLSRIPQKYCSEFLASIFLINGQATEQRDRYYWVAR